MFYVFNVIKVRWVTMVNISGLCGHTQRSSERAHLCDGCDKKETGCTRRLLQTHSTFSKSVMVSVHACVQVGATEPEIHRR